MQRRTCPNLDAIANQTTTRIISRNTLIRYEELKSSKLAEGVDEKDIDHSALFYQANGGKNKRGRSYGCGSETVFLSCSRCKRCKPIQGTNAKVKVLHRRLTVVERELVELRELFEKMHGGCSSSAVPPPCDDENVDGDDIDPVEEGAD